VLAVASLGLTLFTSLIGMPVNAVLLIGLSVVLAIVGLALLGLASQPTDRRLSIVALGNTSVAFVLAFWVLARWAQFSVGGRLAMGLTVAAFLVLAVGELLGTLAGETPIRART